MIKSAKYIHSIIEGINILRQELIALSSLSWNDENRAMENFVRDLYNIAYSSKYENLNERQNNYPGIDLGYNGLGIQVTSDKTSNKVNETIFKIENSKEEVYKEFPKLQMFILSDKQGSYTINPAPTKVTFDWEKDVIDFDDFYHVCLNLDIDKQEKLAEYIYKQLPQLFKDLGKNFFDNYSILGKRIEIKVSKSEFNENQYTHVHNFGYKPHATLMSTTGVVMMTSPIIDETKVSIFHAGGGMDGILILS